VSGKKFPEAGEAKNYPYSEDEIDLADYLRILWKWKRLIISGTLICGFVAGIVSFLMPEIYEVSSVIEPGIIGFNKEGSFIYVDSPVNIKEKINKGAYNREIQKALHLDPKAKIKFEVTTGREAKVIKITSQWEEKKINLGVEATQKLLQLISNDYKKVVEQRKSDINKQILLKQNEISKIETQKKDIDKQIKLKLNKIEKIQREIKLQQANLENIREKKKVLLEEMKKVKENTEKIIQQRDKLLRSKGSGRDISLLLYSTTIQQNIIYFNQLSNQIYDLRAREKKIEAEIDKLSRNIDDVKTEIERLNLKKTESLQAKIDDIKAKIDALNMTKRLISTTKVIQKPQASLYPVKPKKKLNIAISLILGLFFMTFLAFFLEYLKESKNKIFAK